MDTERLHFPGGVVSRIGYELVNVCQCLRLTVSVLVSQKWLLRDGWGVLMASDGD